MSTGPTITVAAPGADVRAALWRSVEAAKADDPLAPVTIAAPSPYAGLTLRHRLAGRGGLVNVRFMSLHRIAELLGAPFLADGRRPLTPVHRIEATRLAVRQASSLDPSPRTVDAVAATLDAAARHGLTPTGALADIAEARATLLADFYDDEEQLLAAANVVAGGSTALDDLGTVVWYLPGHPTPGALAFSRALADAARLAIVDVAVDDPLHGSAYVERSGDLRSMFRAVDVTSSAPPTATDILVTSDRDTEVRSVAARILAAADAGTPFHRVAVTFTQTASYLSLIHERFGAAGIPMAGPSSGTLAQSAAGRVLVAFLGAVESGYARDAVVRMLASAPLRPDLADAGVVARWDLISARAGIVAGRDAWTTKLAGLARRRERKGDLATQEAARSLADTVAVIFDPGGGWSERAAHAVAVLDHLLGDGAHLGEGDRSSIGAVADVLASTASLDDFGGDADAFATAIDHALAAPDGRVGTVGTGVLVTPMAAVVGADFDHVYVLGTDEAATTTAGTDDPLLPGHGLGEVERRRRREAFLGALACAPTRTLTLARADLRAERALSPSPWALESAAVLAGRPVSASELLDADPEHRWLDSVDSFSVLVSDRPPGPDEATLAALTAWRARGADRAHLPVGGAQLARGFEALEARGADRAGPWDGVVGPLAGLAPDDERPFSATGLETWASCPFRYFMRGVLRVYGLEHPEELERMDPRVRGTLVHEALAEFVGNHVGRNPDEAWSDDDRAELIRIVDRMAGDSEAEGLTGHPALWALDRRKIDTQIRGFLDADDEYRATHGVSPLHVEIGFGGPREDHRLDDATDAAPTDPASAEPTSTDSAPTGESSPKATDTEPEFAPLDVEAGGHRLRFRGQIDRVDIAPDGDRVEVIDYKTGTPVASDLGSDPVAAGTVLQPVLYAMVMRREHPDATVGFRYWYTRTPDDPFDRLETVDDAAEARLHEVVGTVTGAIADGVFPREPGEDGHFGPTNCSWCEFARVCPSDRVRIAKSRVDDPAFEPLRDLSDTTSEDEE